MSDRGQALRNTFFSSVTIYVEYLLGMLASILVARELEPAQFGRYSLIIWMAGIGLAFTNSGTATAMIKFVAELRGGHNENMIPTVVRFLRRAQHVFLFAVAVVGGLVLWWSRDKLLPLYDHRLIFALLLVAVSLRAPYMLNMAVAKGFNSFKTTAIITSIVTPINFLMVAAAWFLHASILGFLAVYLVTGILFFVVSWWQVHRLEAPLGRGVPMPPELRRRVLRHMRIVAVTVAVSFLGASDIELLFLNLYENAAAGGQFKVAYQLATGAALLVPGVFSALLLPMMAEAVVQGENRARRRFVDATVYLALLAVPLMVFGVVFAQPIIAVLYGASYAPAALVFAVVLCGACIGTTAHAASSLLLSADRQHQVLILSVFLTILKIGLDLWWIRMAGLDGATAANLVVSIVGAAAIMSLAMRTLRTPLAWNTMGRIVLAGMLTALLAWPLHYYFSPWPRLILGFLVVSLVYALATLLLGCWRRSDVRLMHELLLRFGHGRPRALLRFLNWSAERFGRGD